MKNSKKILTTTLAAAFALSLAGAVASVTPVKSGAEEAQAYDKVFDFTTASSFDDVSMFSVGIDPSKENADLGYTSDGWVTYEKAMNEMFTFESGLKVDTAKYSGDEVSENRIYVRYNAEQMKYFKAELTYSYDDTARNGWAGLTLGCTDYTRQVRWGDNPSGIEFFIQKEGKGTYAGSKISNSDYKEGATPSNWAVNGEHTLTIIANESGISFTADGTEVISLSKATLDAASYSLGNGYVGFMFTNAQFTAKTFKVTNLASGGDSSETPDSDVTLESQTYVENYDFTTATDFDAVSMFSAGIDPATNSTELGYTSDGWVTYEKAMNEMFTLDNGLKVNASLYSGSDVSENNIYVRYNKKQLQYFKAELTYTYDDTERDGWAGFIFGYNNPMRKARWGDSPYGVELFVQRAGKGTYSSSKLNNSNYTEGNIPNGWTANAQHTLTVIAKESGVVLYADGVEVISISQAKMQETGYVLNPGNIGFMFTNAQFTAKSFKLSPLNAAGEEYVAVESVSVSAPSEVGQFEALELSATVLPENATLKTVKYELPAGATESNGKIYFAKPGQYTIKALAVDNEAIADEFTVTVTENSKYVAYATTAEKAGENFENYYVTTGGSKDGAPDVVENYWNFNEDGSMTLKEKKKNAVDAGYVLLYLKDVVNGLAVNTNSFEINYMVKTSSDTPNGWHGVGFAIGDRSTVPNQDGVSAFIQEEALKATLWGSGKGGVGGPNEVDSLYTREQWNLIRVRVYGAGTQKIEMYVNDMTVPIVSTTAASLPATDIALFTTTTITIGNVYFTHLDAQGNPIQMVYPESIRFADADKTTATVGDRLQLVPQILPVEVTDNSVLYTSSNALVATVNAEGLVTFLNAGTTTITAKCKANPAISTEVTFTVNEKEVLPTSISFDAEPTTAEVGGKYTLFVTVGPENVTNYNVIFSSSNENVATVDENGRLNYVGAGETTITVVCEADENVKASFTLVVTGGESSSDTTSGDTQSGGCGGVVSGIAVISTLAAVAFALTKKKEN